MVIPIILRVLENPILLLFNWHSIYTWRRELSRFLPRKARKAKIMIPMPTSTYVARSGGVNEEPVQDDRPLLVWTLHPALAGEFILLLRKGGIRVAPVSDTVSLFSTGALDRDRRDEQSPA